MSRKVQTQLLVNRNTRDRADALALITGETRADVLRRALEGGGLREMEVIHFEKLRQLDPHAERFGLTRTELAGLMVEQKISVEDLPGLESFPPSEQAAQVA